jgi:hypothetical protein
MDPEKMKVQRNPNNDLKYFSEEGYKKEHTGDNNEEPFDESTIEYITE